MGANLPSLVRVLETLKLAESIYSIACSIVVHSTFRHVSIHVLSDARTCSWCASRRKERLVPEICSPASVTDCILLPASPLISSALIHFLQFALLNRNLHFIFHSCLLALTPNMANHYGTERPVMYSSAATLNTLWKKITQPPDPNFLALLWPVSQAQFTNRSSPFHPPQSDCNSLRDGPRGSRPRKDRDPAQDAQ